jgi:hypothetical protein
MLWGLLRGSAASAPREGASPTNTAQDKSHRA